MKRILHYFSVRRRALKLRRISENTARPNMRPLVKKEEIYIDDGDLGYC